MVQFKTLVLTVGAVLVMTSYSFGQTSTAGVPDPNPNADVTEAVPPPTGTVLHTEGKLVPKKGSSNQQTRTTGHTLPAKLTRVTQKKTGISAACYHQVYAYKEKLKENLWKKITATIGDPFPKKTKEYLEYIRETNPKLLKKIQAATELEYKERMQGNVDGAFYDYENFGPASKSPLAKALRAATKVSLNDKNEADGLFHYWDGICPFGLIFVVSKCHDDHALASIYANPSSYFWAHMKEVSSDSKTGPGLNSTIAKVTMKFSPISVYATDMTGASVRCSVSSLSEDVFIADADRSKSRPVDPRHLDSDDGTIKGVEFSINLDLADTHTNQTLAEVEFIMKKFPKECKQ